MINDKQFRVFLFKISVPIFITILTTNSNELVRHFLPPGNLASPVILSVGFCAVIALLIQLVWENL